MSLKVDEMKIGRAFQGPAVMGATAGMDVLGACGGCGAFG